MADGRFILRDPVDGKFLASKLAEDKSGGIEVLLGVRTGKAINALRRVERDLVQAARLDRRQRALASRRAMGGIVPRTSSRGLWQMQPSRGWPKPKPKPVTRSGWDQLSLYLALMRQMRHLFDGPFPNDYADARAPWEGY